MIDLNILIFKLINVYFLLVSHVSLELENVNF
jgi:hypothetical protein